MNKLKLDFAKFQVYIDRDSQTEVSTLEELPVYRKAILDAAKLPEGGWDVLEFDFEAGTVRADGVLMSKLEPTGEAERAVYGAFGYEAVDMQEVVSFVEQFVNGVIDEEALKHGFDDGKER